MHAAFEFNSGDDGDEEGAAELLDTIDCRGVAVTKLHRDDDIDEERRCRRSGRSGKMSLSLTSISLGAGRILNLSNMTCNGVLVGYIVGTSPERTMVSSTPAPKATSLGMNGR